MLGGIDMWIAKDENGLVFIYDTKPVKDKHGWVIPNTGACSLIDLELDDFEKVKWEDKEPRELILKPIKEK